jgi:hypothetical protein
VSIPYKTQADEVEALKEIVAYAQRRRAELESEFERQHTALSDAEADADAGLFWNAYWAYVPEPGYYAFQGAHPIVLHGVGDNCIADWHADNALIGDRPETVVAPYTPEEALRLVNADVGATFCDRCVTRQAG